MTAAKHARLAPSAAHRWVRCPGSVQAEEAANVGDSSSEYARLGTAAHELAYRLLKAGKRDACEFQGMTVYGGLDPEGENMDPHEADEDMCDTVQQYLDVVWACHDRLDGAVMAVEHRVRVPGEVDDIWGTLDCRVSQPFGELHVFDYKHGSGVPVDAVGNEQLLLYALGTLHEEGLGEHEEVSMHIVQPRARHADGETHRTWTVTEAEVLQWWDEVALPAAEEARHSNAELNAGDHCRFCDAAATCPELRRKVQEVAATDFAEPERTPARIAFLGRETMDADAQALSEAMHAVPLLDAFVKAVETEALRRLADGVEVPGFKLVRKKSNRAWPDPDAALRHLLKIRGVRKADLMTEPALRSPAQVEKVKAVGKAAVAPICHKPPGGPTVAADRDPRPAVDPADFKAEGAILDFAEE